jgi:hypothetical protein
MGVTGLGFCKTSVWLRVPEVIFRTPRRIFWDSFSTVDGIQAFPYKRRNSGRDDAAWGLNIGFTHKSSR